MGKTQLFRAAGSPPSPPHPHSDLPHGEGVVAWRRRSGAATPDRPVLPRGEDGASRRRHSRRGSHARTARPRAAAATGSAARTFPAGKVSAASGASTFSQAATQTDLNSA